MNIQERKNKNGKITSYRVRVFDHRDTQTGKQIFKNLSVKYDDAKSESWNRKNAEKQGAIFENAIDEHTATTSNITFDSYAEYCKKIKLQTETITKSTAVGYSYKQRRLAPFIGHIRLKDITPNVLNKKYLEMLEADVPIKTVHELHIFIHGVLTMALKESNIPRNYASAATPPKNERKKVVAMTGEELNNFFTALYAEKNRYTYQVFFSLLIATGCRIGELCALSWRNVDFNKGRIYICQHFVADETGVHVEDGAKTVSGKRWLYLDDDVMKMLSEYHQYYVKKAQEYGSKWNHEVNAVFPSRQKYGDYIPPHTVREWLSRFLKRHDLPHVSPHQFRHTSISLQLEAGISVSDTSKRAGHSRPDVTYRFYAHTLRNNDRHCSEAITKALPSLPQPKN